MAGAGKQLDCTAGGDTQAATGASQLRQLSLAPGPAAAWVGTSAVEGEPLLQAGSSPGPGRIDRRHASQLSYSQFVRDYMAPNIPVIIEGASEGWKAQQEWVRSDGSLNLDFLQERFGQASVKATDTARQLEGCLEPRAMQLREFITWWRQRAAAGSGGVGEGQPAAADDGGERGQGDGRHAAAASGDTWEGQGQCAESGEGMLDGEGELLYVKDWHFHNEFPDYMAYTCPIYFQDDWLNEWYDSRRGAQQAQHAGRQQAQQAQRKGFQDIVEEVEQAYEGLEGQGGWEECFGGDDVASDYRFVYVGPQATWTPLHSDVLRSFSWSTNVAGRKRWRLLHPRYTHLLYDRNGLDLAPDFFLPGKEGEEQEFPGLVQARQHMIEVVQEAGESIFVPSGWHHTVHNIEDTLSINHNWINGHNAHWVWHLVSREYAEAQEMIEDCREITSPTEFEGLVQRNLRANCSLDFATLGEFMRSIAQHSMVHLAACEHTQQTQQDQQEASSRACQGCMADEAAWRAGGSMCQSDSWGAPAPAACCAHHILRLRRSGLVLQQLVEAQERIYVSCQLARQAPALGPVGDGGVQQEQQQQQRDHGGGTRGHPEASKGAAELQQAEQAPHAEQIAANRECLVCMRGTLAKAGLARLAVWGGDSVVAGPPVQGHW